MPIVNGKLVNNNEEAMKIYHDMMWEAKTSEEISAATQWFLNAQNQLDKSTKEDGPHLEDQMQQSWKNIPATEENQTTSSPTTSSPTTSSPTTSSPTTSSPTITDKTNENIESPINGTGYYDQWIAYQKEQQRENWKREDEVRKENQEREDNAWQRAVKDMRLAGVNPNLVNAGPAASGGGIYNATQADNSTLNTAMTSEVSKYATDIEAETANLDREMQMKIAQVQANLERYLAQYNGDIQLTLQAFEHEQEKLIAEIEQNYAKEIAEIEQKYSKEIQYLEQKFTGKENKKNRIVTILTSLAGIFSISKLFKK